MLTNERQRGHSSEKRLSTKCHHHLTLLTTDGVCPSGTPRISNHCRDTARKIRTRLVVQCRLITTTNGSSRKENVDGVVVVVWKASKRLNFTANSHVPQFENGSKNNPQYHSWHRGHKTDRKKNPARLTVEPCSGYATTRGEGGGTNERHTAIRTHVHALLPASGTRVHGVAGSLAHFFRFPGGHGPFYLLSSISSGFFTF